MQPTPAVAVYEAEPIPGPDGTVEWWDSPISDAAAIARLQAGEDIVVRGPDQKANKNKAKELMTAAYGGYEEDAPHRGQSALPHFHPPNQTPEGIHAFYETTRRRAKKRK